MITPEIVDVILELVSKDVPLNEVATVLNLPLGLIQDWLQRGSNEKKGIYHEFYLKYHKLWKLSARSFRRDISERGLTDEEIIKKAHSAILKFRQDSRISLAQWKSIVDEVCWDLEKELLDEIEISWENQ